MAKTLSDARRPDPTTPGEGSPANGRSVAPQALTARHLLGPLGRVVIEHDGARYELRLTRNNKLILTK